MSGFFGELKRRRVYGVRFGTLKRVGALPTLQSFVLRK